MCLFGMYRYGSRDCGFFIEAEELKTFEASAETLVLQYVGMSQCGRGQPFAPPPHFTSGSKILLNSEF